MSFTEQACLLARLSFNVSMVMFAVSYAVRDLYRLRILAVVAGLLGLPYFVFCCGDTRWDALLWNALFTLIHVVRLAYGGDERPSVVAPEEAEV